MQIFRKTASFELHQDIADIFLKYTLLSHITKDCKMYLMVGENKLTDTLKDSIEVSLETLKTYGYIRDYSKVIKVGNKYKECAGSSTPKDLEGYKTQTIRVEIPFVVYHYKNKAKWDFIYNLVTHTDSKIDIDVQKLKQTMIFYDEDKRLFNKAFKNILINYGEYLQYGKETSRGGIEDFLIFLMYDKKLEFQKFYTDISDNFYPFNLSKIYLENNLLMDKNKKTVLELTNGEFRIINLLKQHNSRGGISKENLFKSTHQTQGAFETMLTALNKKIKDNNLHSEIDIHHSSSEKVYTIRINNIVVS